VPVGKTDVHERSSSVDSPEGSRERSKSKLVDKLGETLAEHSPMRRRPSVEKMNTTRIKFTVLEVRPIMS